MKLDKKIINLTIVETIVILLSFLIEYILLKNFIVQKDIL